MSAFEVLKWLLFVLGGNLEKVIHALGKMYIHAPVNSAPHYGAILRLIRDPAVLQNLFEEKLLITREEIPPLTGGGRQLDQETFLSREHVTTPFLIEECFRLLCGWFGHHETRLYESQQFSLDQIRAIRLSFINMLDLVDERKVYRAQYPRAALSVEGGVYAGLGFSREEVITEALLHYEASAREEVLKGFDAWIRYKSR